MTAMRTRLMRALQAADGDADALATLIQRCAKDKDGTYERLALRALMGLLDDEEPHPLALLIVSALAPDAAACPARSLAQRHAVAILAELTRPENQCVRDALVAFGALHDSCVDLLISRDALAVPEARAALVDLAIARPSTALSVIKQVGDRLIDLVTPSEAHALMRRAIDSFASLHAHPAIWLMRSLMSSADHETVSASAPWMRIARMIAAGRPSPCLAALWTSLDEPERQTVLDALTDNDAALIARMPHPLWDDRDESSRTALLRAAMRLPVLAAMTLASVEPGDARMESEQERARFLDIVIRDDRAAAGLLGRLIMQDIPTMTAPERERLWHAASASPWMAAHVLACLDQTTFQRMSRHERACLLRSASHWPYGLARALVATGDGSLHALHPDEIAIVADAAQRDQSHQAAAMLAFYWMALDHDVRRTLLEDATMSPISAAKACIALGDAGWRALPPTEQTWIVERIADRPDEASTVAGALWMALDADHWRMLFRSAVRRSSAAVAMLRTLGHEGWDALTEQERHALVRSAARRSEDAVHALRILNQRHDHRSASQSLADRPLRDVVIAASLRSKDGARHVAHALCACDWAALTAKQQRIVLHVAPPVLHDAGRAILDAADRIADAERRARLVRLNGLMLGAALADITVHDPDVGAAWDAMHPDDRRTIIDAVAADIHAAALFKGRIAPRLNLRLTHEEQRRLHRLMDAPMSVALYLAAGGRWRAWMEMCIPTDDSNPDVVAAWVRAMKGGAIPMEHLGRIAFLQCAINANPRFGADRRMPAILRRHRVR